MPGDKLPTAKGSLHKEENLLKSGFGTPFHRETPKEKALEVLSSTIEKLPNL
jgi:hypothetical protein